MNTFTAIPSPFPETKNNPIIYINSLSSMSIPGHFHLGCIPNLWVKKIEENIYKGVRFINFGKSYFLKVHLSYLPYIRKRMENNDLYDTNFINYFGNWYCSFYKKGKVIFDYGTLESIGLLSTSNIESYIKIKSMGLINYQEQVSVNIEGSINLIGELLESLPSYPIIKTF